MFLGDNLPPLDGYTAMFLFFVVGAGLVGTRHNGQCLCTVTPRCSRSPVLQSPCACGWFDPNETNWIGSAHLIPGKPPGGGEGVDPAGPVALTKAKAPLSTTPSAAICRTLTG